MGDGGRWDENRRSRGKFDDQVEIPEYKVPARRWIEVPQSSDATPAKRKVGEVAMLVGAGPGAEVESRGSKNTIAEVAAKVGVGLE